MKNKPMYHKLIAGILCTALLYSCGSNKAQTNTGSESAVVEQTNFVTIGDKNISTAIGELVTYDSEDNYTDWKSQNPSYIKLNGNSASVEGSGAAVKGSTISITKAGVYVINGKLDNGQIVVDVEDKGTVRLVLNEAEISCNDNAPIYLKNAGKTVISLQEGTENKIADGEKYTLADASTDEPNAAIFSKDNLVINGSGKLTVHASYNNGITSKDDLKITGGNILIYSKDDGILGRDMVAIKDGKVTIEAGGDGIKSTNDTDASKGFVAIEAGSFDIKSGNDGIQAETNVLIDDGTFIISSGGGSANGITKTNNDMQGPWGNKGSNTTTSNTNTNINTNTAAPAAASTSTNETESAKGIKAAVEIAVGGGSFKIDSADDSIHSNSSVIVAGGDMTITSGDDGIHGDASIVVKGGKVNITKSYEGIESGVITIAEGDIHVTASDDGINVSGGNDGSSVNGRPGENNFSANSSNKLNINGGYIVVNSMGDGLDSNGSIYMTNGTVIVSGPTENNNGALDYNGTFEMTGGFLVAAGSSGMAQATSDSSTQYSIIMNYPNTQAAGTVVHLEDSKGNTIATFAPAKEYQAVVISSPELKKGTSYTLFSGGTSTASQTDGLYADGEYKGGTKVVDFTVSSSVTWLDETGVTTAKSAGPGQGFGGGNRSPRIKP